MSKKLDEMKSLFDELKQVGGNLPWDHIDRGILADWLTDNPQMTAEFVSHFIRHMPEVLLQVISTNLSLKLEEEVDYTTGARRPYVRLTVMWAGSEIKSVDFNT